MSAFHISSSSRTKAIALYRSILKAHRLKLPTVFRSLGDNYVREEFKRHKTAKPEFVKQFFDEWNSYLVILQSQANQGQAFGIDLSANQTVHFSDEQKQQLDKLRDETSKLKSELLKDSDASRR